MTAKVTAKVVIIFIMLASCDTQQEQIDDLHFQQELDSLASASIDSAYKIVLEDCNEKMQVRLPVLVDSLVKEDSVNEIDSR